MVGWDKGWDGKRENKGWDVMGYNGMGWDGMGSRGHAASPAFVETYKPGWDGTGRDGMVLGGILWHGIWSEGTAWDARGWDGI